VPLQDVAVLEGSGLALVRVDYQICWFGRLLWDEGPLSTGWKPRAAQTAQLGSRNLVDHLFGRHGGDSFPCREISAVRDVVFEPRSTRILEARGKHRPVRADEGFRLRGRFRFPGFRESVLDDPVDSLALKGADEALVELGHGRHLASAQALDLR